MILFELDCLKSSIEEALHASVRPSRDFSRGLSSDTRVARNLRNFAMAAQQFYSAASSTASTIRDHSGSSIGHLPAYRRERVESFIRSARDHAVDNETPASLHTASPSPIPVVRSPVPSPIAHPAPVRSTRASTTSRLSAQEDVEDDEDYEDEFEELFLNAHEDLARDSIRRTDFEQAISHLTEAFRRRKKTSPGSDHLQRLQTQIALCHLFRNDWTKADPIACDLAATVDSASCLGPIIWTMLHAVALGYLSTYHFDDALKACRKARNVPKKWTKAPCTVLSTVQCYAETTGLLATICDMQGDYISAAIYRRQLPEGLEPLFPYS
ncbi:hypothetical protein VTH06DRAFT_5841 [Thermothelomyces fergusii]